MTNILDNSPLADGDIVGAIVIPCISPVPADRRLSLTQIRNFARAGIELSSLAPEGWLQRFLQLPYDGDQGDAREQLGAEELGAAAAAIAPLYTAFTTLVDELNVVAFSGNVFDLNGFSVMMENLFNATTQAQACAAIGAAQAGGPTRFINDLLEGTVIEILDTDSLVLLEADGWASVRLSMPNGLYDGHTIRVATTGAIGALYAIYGADVINPTPSTTYPDGFACTFIWFYDNAQWVRFG